MKESQKAQSGNKRSAEDETTAPVVDDDVEYFKDEVGEDPDPGSSRVKVYQKPNHTCNSTVIKYFLSELFSNHLGKSASKRKRMDQKPKERIQKKPRTDSVDSKKNSKTPTSKQGEEKTPKKNKKVLTEMDVLRRSKIRREKRLTAKRKGKRANKPRKC